MSLTTTTSLEESTGRTIEVDGRPVHFHDVGEGPVLLMPQTYGPLPGTTAWLTWSRVIGEFAQKYRCILVDHPNFGLTGPLTYHEPVHDVNARTAVAVLDHLGIDEVTAIGNSVGATTVLDLYLRYPGRVKNLVIGGCHASTGGDPYLIVPFPSEVSRYFAESNEEPPDPEKIRRLLGGILYDQDLVTDELVAAAYQARLDHPDHAEARRQSVSTPHSNLLELAKVTVPTLIVHGRFDRMVPYEQALMLLNFIESSNLVLLNRCGHWTQYEQPEQFTSHVFRFLDTVDV
jgi:2-hydroxy-6-oxonona-2,4-dienedioate hydrolase